MLPLSRAYDLDADLMDDLKAALGANVRAVRGVSSKRRSRRPGGNVGRSALPLFLGTSIEEDRGEDLGVTLTDEEADRQLQSLATAVPVERWALPVNARDLRERLGISPGSLDSWAQSRKVVSFADDKGVMLFPVAQFVGAAPAEGLDRVVAEIGDARVAWLWLTQPVAGRAQETPLGILKAYGLGELRSYSTATFNRK